MQINRVDNTNYSLNFKAVVNIKAKPTLLNENGIKELQEIGKKIGDNNTKINMNIDYVKNNPYIYNFSHKTEHTVNEKFKTEKIGFETNEDVVTPTITPLEYGKKLLERINTFISRNTTLQ